MKKYILFLIAASIFLLPKITYGVCVYSELLQDCKQKNDRGQAHLSSDYLCVDSIEDERILYNIILDKEFSAIDKQAYDFLKWLETSKSYFFGPSSNASYFQGIDLVGIKFGKHGEYWNQYEKICDLGRENSINAQVFECLGESGVTILKVTNDNAKDYLANTACMELAGTKLRVYEKVAYDIMKINKAYIRKDNRKRFMQNQRVKYEFLLDSMRINIGYLERIWKKWPSKTKDTYNG